MEIPKLPSKLTSFQKKMYKHLINLKWQMYPETKYKPGIFKGHEYDALFPEDFESDGVPPMLYPKYREKKEQLKGQLGYKPHKFANHAVSSQTACINLFLPLLERKHADEILKSLPTCPPDFVKIDRSNLSNGYCFEFWDEGYHDSKSKGHLGDHSSYAGTDSDVAIAYLNAQGEKCIWLIEHKLTELEFTECGGYKSKNTDSANCNSCNPLSTIPPCKPSFCTYFQNFKYWHITEKHLDAFTEVAKNLSYCPFKKGMNQLWRNQLLAFALVDNKRFASAHFSVVYHSENKDLEDKLKEYEKYFSHNAGFNYFTPKDIIEIADKYKVDTELVDWVEWYKNTYYIGQ